MGKIGNNSGTDSDIADEIAGDEMLDAATGGVGAADTFDVTVGDGRGGVAVPVEPH